ncbi:protein ZINC INDUCED FACILITATOR-LIKE 1 isoform X3 [Helianthus annuus]|uniref:protein ZINC INDUCED FACILITATOR-LIKE 1 isoform X3 n=1 Tax=Helianthus annuus TaxID=4232 RepID=UPI000B907000|nr:protein ZINC INDUCED FACILITATOR-LIKE 1 isoform X3 [Helianthus annuus]
MAINDELLEQVYHENCPGCKVDRRKRIQTGLPIKELICIWVVVLCVVLPISSLYPFIYFMVRDFNIAEKEEDISYYAGFVGSAYMIGRALSSVLWGVVADRYGRKPIIILGTSTVVIFNTIFGFSFNYWMAIITRFLLGFLNGILGTIKAYACEIFPQEYQALGLSATSTSWGIGLIIGPALGGFLAQPAEKFPSLVSSDSLFGRFPYLLPYLCISIFAFVVTIIAIWLPIFSLWAESPKSLGGLNYTTEDVGIVLSITGVCLLLFHTAFFPIAVRIFGPLMVARISGVLSIPLLTAYPYIALLSGFILTFTLNLASIVKNILSISIITGTVMLQNKAVDQHQRGAANGIAMTLQATFNAIGPSCGGTLLSWSLKRQNVAFLPGAHMIFFLLNIIEGLGVLLTFKPFFIANRN